MNNYSQISIEKIFLSISNKFFFKNLNIKFLPTGISVIIGPNGSGKTLLLKVIAGIIKVDSGIVNIENNNKIRVGYSPQNIVFLRRNVYENLSYVLKTNGFKKKQIAPIIDSFLKDFKIYGKRNSSARNLSGGLAQYLSFIRAIILKPNLLILDEPCSNLDSKFKKKIEEYLVNEKKQKKIILVTHDIFQAKRLADEIILFNDGQIIEKNRTDKFLNSKQTLVRRFLQDNLL